MVVHTHTPRVLKARRAILELLVASHPQDCLSCVRGGDCELAALAGDLGVRGAALRGRRQGSTPWTSAHPALWRDPNKCVLCGRCVTVCHDVQGVGAIDFTGRGFKHPRGARVQRRPQRERVRLLRPVRARVPDRGASWSATRWTTW